MLILLNPLLERISRRKQVSTFLIDLYLFYLRLTTTNQIVKNVIAIDAVQR